MIIKRNLLCIKAKEKLELGQILLYEPYKNILGNFKDLCVNINAKDFDPVAKVYDGLLSIPLSPIKNYYEALLGVTSYYQHSQGGRGKYIEKKLASSFDTCTLNIELNEFPLWLEFPNVHKKKGIYTQQGLSWEEKKIIRESEWNWIGSREVRVDVGSIIKNEHTIVLVEIKNRVDTGGTSGRREIWTSSKFGVFADCLKTNEKLFEAKDKKFSLVEFLEHWNIKTLELYVGVLFDKNDNPASIEADRLHGFYSSSKDGFHNLTNLLRQSSDLKVLTFDETNLRVEIGLTYSKLKVNIGALYGNDVTLKLFRKPWPVSDILLLKYDDIWLSQLITIDERSILLRYRKNYSTIFLSLLKRDYQLRREYGFLIDSECSEDNLIHFLEYLFNQYSASFEDEFLPQGKDKKAYLADVIQVLCACEA